MLEGWGSQRGDQLPPASHSKAGPILSFSTESRSEWIEPSTEEDS